MTQPVQEQLQQRAISALDYRVRQLARRPPLTSLGTAIYEIKVFEDTTDIATGDDKFVWEIPEDLDGATIVKVEAYISTAGGSTTQVDIRLSDPCDIGASILTTKISIDTGECNSSLAATQPVVADATDVVHGDHLHIDVDAAGSGAKGLGVIVALAPSALASVAVQGAKGDTGGVDNFTGQWDSGTTYNAGDAVYNNGTTYVAIATSTNVEPGVDLGWEAFWVPLVETNRKAGIQCMIHSESIGTGIDTGIKGYAVVPFDCTLTEATLLSSAAATAEFDIWKDTYGAFPPTIADSITGGSPLTLAGVNKSQDSTLAGWTTALLEGDVLSFVNTGGVITVENVTIALKVERA